MSENSEKGSSPSHTQCSVVMGVIKRFPGFYGSPIYIPYFPEGWKKPSKCFVYSSILFLFYF
jgi:hypothetical protein